MHCHAYSAQLAELDLKPPLQAKYAAELDYGFMLLPVDAHSGTFHAASINQCGAGCAELFTNGCWKGELLIHRSRT